MVAVKDKNVSLMDDYSFHVSKTTKNLDQIGVLDLVLDVARIDSHLEYGKQIEKTLG